MELHLVHWNTKYNNVEEAVDKTDGLAVVAFLYQVSCHRIFKSFGKFFVFRYRSKRVTMKI